MDALDAAAKIVKLRKEYLERLRQRKKILEDHRKAFTKKAIKEKEPPNPSKTLKKRSKSPKRRSKSPKRHYKVPSTFNESDYVFDEDGDVILPKRQYKVPSTFKESDYVFDEHGDVILPKRQYRVPSTFKESDFPALYGEEYYKGGKKRRTNKNRKR